VLNINKFNYKYLIIGFIYYLYGIDSFLLIVYLYKSDISSMICYIKV